MPRCFLAACRRFGERVALREKDYGIWQELTWRDYLHHVRRLAQGLAVLGLRRGEAVCIQAENCLEWLFTDLAVQSSGGVVVGVYPTNPMAEVEYIARHANARLYVAQDQEQVDKILAVKHQLPELRRIVVMNMKGVTAYRDPLVVSFKEVERLGEGFGREHPGWFEEAVAATHGDDLSVIIYTSGTTGPPKGAMISHRNVIESTRALLDVLPMTAEDSVLSYLPLCHAMERIFSLYIPLEVGSVVNFAEGTGSVQRNLREIGPTVFVAVPRIWEKMKAEIEIRVEDSTRIKRAMFGAGWRLGEGLARRRLGGRWGLTARGLRGVADVMGCWAVRDKLGLRHARYLLSGGAPISPRVLLFFHGLGLPVRELYGMTEVTNVFTLNFGDQIRLGTVGRALPGYDVRVEEDGEILLRGPGVFQGYHRDPEGTREAVVDGWVRSGDLGCLDEAGHLVITGRKKDIFITSGGKNTAPQRIENALKASPFIKEAVVVGDGRQYLTALIELDLDTVGSWCRARNVPYTTLRDLARNDRVVGLVAGEVDRVNEDLSRVEQIKKFRLLEKNLDHEDGEVTATQKVRRAFLTEKFRGLVDEMYRQG